MDTRKDCCKIPENLESQPTERQDFSVMKCRVCGCRHFELTVDPIVLKLKGHQIGFGNLEKLLALLRRLVERK
jgi:hypothetical protein